MLTIRMHRIGKTNQPSFKIVVVDKRRSAAAGSFNEEVGQVNRTTKTVKLNNDRIVYWLKQGAIPSPSVHNLLVAQKLVEGKKIPVHAQPKKKDQKGAPAAGAAKAAPEAPVAKA